MGKIQTAAYSWRSSCTGALVGPTTVLTAAHCVFNAQSGRYFPPSSLHFLIGDDGDSYVGHANVVGFVIGPGYDRAHARETLGSDWALLTIDAKLGTPDRILALRDRPPEIGTRVMIGGYSEDRPYVLTADLSCRIVGQATDAHGGHLLRHDCTGTRGVSGAPVLVEEHGAWSIGGVAVAAQMGASIGFAATIEAARKRL